MSWAFLALCQVVLLVINSIREKVVLWMLSLLFLYSFIFQSMNLCLQVTEACKGGFVHLRIPCTADKAICYNVWWFERMF